MASKMKKNVKAGTKSGQSKKRTTKPAEPLEPEPQTYDSERCGTPGCAGEPTLTLLGKPICAACWERHCETEDTGARAPADPAPAEASPAPETAPETPKKTRSKKPAAEPKPKRVSALDAAAQLLAASGRAMTTQEMVVEMAQQGLWESPAGKTPHATLYSAILREIGTKGAEARFRKADRGMFVAA